MSLFEKRHFHQHRPHAKSYAPSEDLLHVVNSSQQILGRLAPRILGFADKKLCNMGHVYSCIKIFIGGSTKTNGTMSRYAPPLKMATFLNIASKR